MTFPVGEASIYYYAPFVWSNGYMSSAPIEKLFESGRAAFKFGGAWEVNTIYQNYPDIDLGVAPYVVSDSWDTIFVVIEAVGARCTLRCKR